MERAPSLSFVLGTGRCGSTVFHEILVGHPDVAFVSNLEDHVAALAGTTRWNSRLYRPARPTTTRKARLRFAPSEAYDALAREVSPMLVDPVRDLRRDDLTPWLERRLVSFFEARRHAQGRTHLSHKLTGWPRAELLAAAFADARFVHVHRDGRAVASSWLQMPWWRGHLGPSAWHFGPLPDDLAERWERSGRSFVALAGLGWVLLMRRYREVRTSIGAGRWTDLPYERLVEDPDGSFASILDFLGLDADAEFDRWRSRWPLHLDARDRFRSDLGPDAVAVLDDVMADELGAWGYL